MRKWSPTVRNIEREPKGSKGSQPKGAQTEKKGSKREPINLKKHNPWNGCEKGKKHGGRRTKFKTPCYSKNDKR